MTERKNKKYIYRKERIGIGDMFMYILYRRSSTSEYSIWPIDSDFGYESVRYFRSLEDMKNFLKDPSNVNILKART